MSAYNINGYIQGFKFNQENYDADSKEFKDLAGYGIHNNCKVTAGDPVFETVNDNDCVLLDNTWHGKFISAIPYSGSMIAVIKPNLSSESTLGVWPLITGDSTTTTSNGGVLLQHSSGARKVHMWTGGASNVSTLSRSDDNAIVVVFSRSQENQIVYSSSDGVTVNESASLVSTTVGSPTAWSCGIDGVRFGQLNADSSDLTEKTDFNLNFFELHFFAGDILNNQLSVTKAFIDELKLKYSAS